MKRKFIFIFILLISTRCFGFQTYSEVMKETSDRCSRHFDYIEKRYDLPFKLLESISLIESGRYNSTSKKLLPWPWAVNNAGKSYYFDTKSEAVAAVKDMLKRGITNIDVGCMQINLNYHGKNFKSLNHAFEPRHNIDFAANLLKKHYEKHSNWQTAIAAYHSFSDLGKIYYTKVMNIWRNQYKYNRHNEVKKISDDDYNEQEHIKRDHHRNFIHNSPRMRPDRLKSSLIVN